MLWRKRSTKSSWMRTTAPSTFKHNLEAWTSKNNKVWMTLWFHRSNLRIISTWLIMCSTSLQTRVNIFSVPLLILLLLDLQTIRICSMIIVPTYKADLELQVMELNSMQMVRQLQSKILRNYRSGNFSVDNFSPWMWCLTLSFFYQSMIPSISSECHFLPWLITRALDALP